MNAVAGVSRRAARASLPATLAAVDLGSNSFHAVVARVEAGALHVIDRLREPVRLAAGLDQNRMIDEAAIARGLDCLARFGQRLRDMPRGSVRVVGTNTLRSARNGEHFRLAAEQALGHPVEVIAGREEARLIYLGVAHALAGDRRRRLVVDIGGGSTECIVGEGFEAEHRESLYMGCVSMSNRFFGDGRIDKARMKAAELAALVEIEPVAAQFRAAHWEAAVGCSGTVRAIEGVVKAQGWSSEGISRTSLRKLRRALIAAGSVDAIALKELRDDRRPVFVGGVAVLTGLFEALDIEHMTISDMALREGLMYDLIGRFRHEDVRGTTVRALAERYGADARQARRVGDTALACLAQVAAGWSLAGDNETDILRWAADLHEIGLAVSHNQYHKHGAYLLQNADMAGFSRQEQQRLAALVRGHRRKFPVQVFDTLPGPDARQARHLCVLLRLGVLLHRSRERKALPPLTLEADGAALRLVFPPGWLDRHPLTHADLAQEQGWLAPAGVTLTFG